MIKKIPAALHLKIDGFPLQKQTGLVFYSLNSVIIPKCKVVTILLIPEKWKINIGLSKVQGGWI